MKNSRLNPWRNYLEGVPRRSPQEVQYTMLNLRTTSLDIPWWIQVGIPWGIPKECLERSLKELLEGSLKFFWRNSKKISWKENHEGVPGTFPGEIQEGTWEEIPEAVHGDNLDDFLGKYIHQFLEKYLMDFQQNRRGNFWLSQEVIHWGIPGVPEGVYEKNFWFREITEELFESIPDGISGRIIAEFSAGISERIPKKKKRILLKNPREKLLESMEENLWRNY